MREMIKMVVVLTLMTSAAGGLLAAVRSGTKDRIENQQLEFVKGPAIRSILNGASNDPIVDRFKIQDGDTERSFFVGIFDGKANRIAFESAAGKGYGGNVGLMVGISMDDDQLIGVGVTTHSETPGMGAKAKDDPGFSAQFRGLDIADPVKVTKDGGKINAISGATITSRAVCSSATDAIDIYKRLKPRILENIKAIKK
jgi:Na+-translocating ferredoxin:NAD+ oxidoreductase subunit G